MTTPEEVIKKATSKDVFRAFYFMLKQYRDMAKSVVDFEKEQPEAFDVVKVMTVAPREVETVREYGARFLDIIKEMSTEDAGHFIKILAEGRIEWEDFLKLPLNDKLKFSEDLNRVTERLQKYFSG